MCPPQTNVLLLSVSMSLGNRNTKDTTTAKGKETVHAYYYVQLCAFNTVL